MKLHILPFVLLLGACATTPPVDYYQGRWDPPSIDKVSADKQTGNISGDSVTISGSGFGSDASKVMVQFGNHNATILDAADGSLTVLVPPGPVGGGVVPVTVATYTGFATGEYTYDVAAAAAAADGKGGDGTAGQVGYILVSNYWESCFGGLSSRLEDTYGKGNFADCQTLSYLGQTGLVGSAEALEFAVERLHAGNQGWSGASDVAGNDWKVERPSEAPYIGGLDDFHVDLGKVTITNDYWKDDDGYCVSFGETASYRYGGGLEDFEAPTSLSGDGFPAVVPGKASTCGDTQTFYPADELQFCSRADSQGIDPHIYDADWPINQDFFEANNRKLKSVDVELHLPDVGVDAVKLALPEPLVVYNTEGYDDIFTSSTGAQDAWAAYGSMQHCFDDNGRGEDLSDVALSFEWPVSEVEYPEPGGSILGVHSYVRASITELSLGWFGGLGYPVRATITVPDDNDSYQATNSSGDKEKRGRIEIPASVMYQLPTIKFPVGGGPQGAGFVVAKPTDNLGYMFIEFQRVTEYTVDTDAGPVVFVYVTGDFGFTEWTNPTQDACHDCVDNDGDGWSDNEDPDCATGTDEVGAGTTACSDGIDNDHDGSVDADDDACASADDDDESNCDDKLDNDGDGLKDAADADCARGDNETLPDGCVDGVDNDGDGWADADDPECIAGDAEAGFGTTGCNDGLDGDSDGWVDAGDPDCASAGGTEQGFGLDVCNDGLDNDGNGDADAADPECGSATDGDESI